MAIRSTQKQIYDALREHVIPWAKHGELVPVLASIPLETPDSVSVIKIANPLLGKSEHHPLSLNPDRWPHLNLHACRYPCLAFVLEGEADVLLGLPRQRATNLKIPKPEPGVRALSLSPRHCCIFPPLTPYPDSDHPYWFRENPEAAHSRTLWLRILPIGAFLHVASTQGLSQRETSVILVSDHHLLVVTQLLIESARNQARATEITKAYLLALVLSIEKSWATNQILPHNASNNVKSVSAPQKTVYYSEAERQDAAVQRVCAYIQSHLSVRLSIPEIAAQTYVSVPQLKRLFHSELHTTVMKYVLQQRMEEAQSLLTQTDINVEDIGGLCGYAHRTHFSRIFTRFVGVSPRAYRKQTRAQKTGKSVSGV